MYEFAGAEAEVRLDIEGDGTSSVQFDVQVLNPAYADIRAVFFNFETFLSDYKDDMIVSGENVTDWQFADNGVTDLGGGALITPAEPFDGGVEIGLAGIGKGDDFYRTSFSLSHTAAITLGDVFGVRLTSVGDYADDREDSSKLVSNTPVPEPATMLLMGAGLVGLAGITRRKARA